MKCALQEFQHMFPLLTTRIKARPPVPPNNEPEASFLPMECPILPLGWDHVILLGRQITNFEYLLLLSFLTAAKF